MGEGEVCLCIPGVCFVCLYMCLFFGFILCVCKFEKKKKILKKKCGSGYCLLTPYLLCHKEVLIIGWNYHGFYQAERQGRSSV